MYKKAVKKKMMRFFKGTNYFVLQISTFVLLALTVVSFFFAWAKDEDTLGKGVFKNIIADFFLDFTLSHSHSPVGSF